MRLFFLKRLFFTLGMGQAGALPFQTNQSHLITQVAKQGTDSIISSKSDQYCKLFAFVRISQNETALYSQSFLQRF